MIGLIQRVSQAAVTVDAREVGRIGPGLLVLVGVQPDDDDVRGRRLLERLLGYRVFPDAEGRMNLSLRDVSGGLLLVPQFTLAADTRKGTRPGFSTAAPPQMAAQLFDNLCLHAKSVYHDVQSGRFGADMDVQLTNRGPVTFWLDA